MDIDTDPCSCMAIEPYMAPSGNVDWDFNMASGDRAGYTLRLFLSTLISSAQPLFIMLKL